MLHHKSRFAVALLLATVTCQTLDCQALVSQGTTGADAPVDFGRFDSDGPDGTPLPFQLHDIRLDRARGFARVRVSPVLAFHETLFVP